MAAIYAAGRSGSSSSGSRSSNTPSKGIMNIPVTQTHIQLIDKALKTLDNLKKAFDVLTINKDTLETLKTTKSELERIFPQLDQLSKHSDLTHELYWGLKYDIIPKLETLIEIETQFIGQKKTIDVQEVIKRIKEYESVKKAYQSAKTEAQSLRKALQKQQNPTFWKKISDFAAFSLDKSKKDDFQKHLRELNVEYQKAEKDYRQKQAKYIEAGKKYKMMEGKDKIPLSIKRVITKIDQEIPKFKETKQLWEKLRPSQSNFAKKTQSV